MIADNYLQLRTELETALSKLLRLSSEMRRDPATLDTLHGLLTDIREPLLFVVVGEVKAGKSSLLNALFGQEFAKVDVLPATDRVYIFRHGAEEKSVEVSAQLTPASIRNSSGARADSKPSKNRSIEWLPSLACVS
jgi:replication fork clamp-binding protein CrfC